MGCRTGPQGRVLLSPAQSLEVPIVLADRRSVGSDGSTSSRAVRTEFLIV